MTELPKGLTRGEDGKARCWWYGGHADYMAYHDEEWGRPQADDFRLFEKLVLEGFQSGLSWLTVLRKRARFREVFHGFDFERVARFDESDIQRLLQDPGIIRHRRKIESAINNARRACELVEREGSLGAFLWSFAPDDASRPVHFDHDTLMSLTKTPASTALAKALKKRGWSFVGPTTAYAFMQATGMVNDHLEGCAHREEVERERKAFSPPGSP